MAISAGLLFKKVPALCLTSSLTTSLLQFLHALTDLDLSLSLSLRQWRAIGRREWSEETLAMSCLRCSTSGM